ncbi:winged helix-turn-helix domain-containing protein [Colwellia piezophila]|uniref:winged helix-turn-helix domain-containing protein n=1 Tax=Colwellia piezophila TaxID=211668 RepID=UPI00036F633D|nr:winged helix-turn-helix domain-containing protein [Colwellia piezophila]
MDVKFSEYRFLRDQLILYKHEEIIPLKRNQALLLDFFITNPDGIHSKDVIMDAVWQDKIVSEQVVFQTISQLRAILGSDAIKTFSKKGYKWEIPLQKVATVDVQPTIIKADKASSSLVKSHWLIYFLAVLLAIVVYLFQTFTLKEQVILHLVHSTKANSQHSENFTELVKKNILKDNRFEVKYTTVNHSSRQSFHTPKLTWKLSSIPDNEWLLWTENFASSNGVFLNYGVSNGDVYWRGYVFGKTHEQVTQKLSERLIELDQLGLFTKPNIKLNISTMTSMMETSPNDPDLLFRLANHYFDVKQLEVAMTYAQKLANADQSYGFSPYRAKAQRLMSDIYKAHRKYKLASNSLKKVSSILADTPLWALKYENISARAWVAQELHDFEKMFKILEQGLEFSQKHVDTLSLFQLHITYSILAKKAGDGHKKYAHLNEAQALLLKHKLNESNFAVVYYHFVIFTKDNSKALPYLEKILLLPRTIHNTWVIEHSTELLIEQYIVQKDFDLARSLLQSRPESPDSLVLTAKLHHATDNKNEARQYFLKAFELARLEHNTHMAVHAAFGLYQLNSHAPKIQAEYMDYLERNALKAWLNDQMKKMDKE